MSMAKVSNDNFLKDCHFFFNSSCNKKGDCPFRHCASALMSEKTCSKWRVGKCGRVDCRFRHDYNIVKRSEIECFYEKGEGCKKIHCPFKHKLPNEIRLAAIATQPLENWILPVSSGERARKEDIPKPRAQKPNRGKSLDRRMINLIESLDKTELGPNPGPSTTRPTHRPLLADYKPIFIGSQKNQNPPKGTQSVSDKLKKMKKP